MLTKSDAHELYFKYQEVYDQDLFDIFYTNLKKIIDHNSNPAKTYSMGINKFAFISDEDFLANYLGAQNCSATAQLTLEKKKNQHVHHKMI